MSEQNSISPCGDAGLVSEEQYFKQDCLDLMNGVSYIPTDVREARVRGEKVTLVKDCQCPNCWYWELPNGLRIYHFEMDTLISLAKKNGRFEEGKPFCEDPGPCPDCGNVHTSGGAYRV